MALSFPVLDILDERIKKLEIWGGVPTNMEYYTPYYDIDKLKNNWEGELIAVSAIV